MDIDSALKFIWAPVSAQKLHHYFCLLFFICFAWDLLTLSYRCMLFYCLIRPFCRSWCRFCCVNTIRYKSILSVIVSMNYFQPRMFMAMARDGLLPSFFSDISERTQVPVKSTVIIGILAAALAFVMDVSQLAGMVCYAFELEMFYEE